MLAVVVEVDVFPLPKFQLQEVVFGVVLVNTTANGAQPLFLSTVKVGVGIGVTVIVALPLTGWLHPVVGFETLTNVYTEPKAKIGVFTVAFPVASKVTVVFVAPSTE